MPITIDKLLEEPLLHDHEEFVLKAGDTMTGSLFIGEGFTTQYAPELTTGGTASASSENSPSEGAAQAFDNNSGTKWLAWAEAATLTYQFGSSATHVVVRYALTSGNDEDTRDPKDWTFEGSNDGSSWDVLDTVTGEDFTSRGQTKTYDIDNTTAYEYYRLNITDNNGASGITQLAELQMYELLANSLGVEGNLEVLGGAVFNQQGNDIDFRIESDTNTHGFFLDSSTSRVGINNDSPASELDVIGTFRFRDAASPTKGVRYRFGGATDVEAGGADLYWSVWSAGDFTGTQHYKAVMESQSDIFQLIRDIQFRNNPHGDTYHTISGQGGVVFNEIGGDNDTRIEGDTDANLLFIDAGTDRVGIGEALPDYKLDVNGAIGFAPGSSVTPVDNGDVVIEATNNTTLTFKLKGSDGTVRTGDITLS